MFLQHIFNQNKAAMYFQSRAAIRKVAKKLRKSCKKVAGNFIPRLI